jgi:hypothetical protein
VKHFHSTTSMLHKCIIPVHAEPYVVSMLIKKHLTNPRSFCIYDEVIVPLHKGSVVFCCMNSSSAIVAGIEEI